jgi:hypothetical protein
MRIDVGRAALFGLTFAVGSGVARAQTREGEQAPRPSSGSFVLARYTSAGSASMYTAVRVGPGLALGGVVANTRTNTYTTLLGVGARTRFTRNLSARVFVAGAHTPTDVQARLYVLPRATAGRVTMSAIGMFAQAFRRDGAHQISANPLSLGLRVAPSLHVGASLVADQVQHRRLRSGAGPSVQVRLPYVALSVDALRWRRGGGDELRATLTASR